jgi:hypothetical protein
MENEFCAINEPEISRKEKNKTVRMVSVFFVKQAGPIKSYMCRTH